MSPAARSLAVAGPLALFAAVHVGLRGPAAARETPPPPAVEVAPPPVPVDRAYDHTAIGAVIRANRNRVPASGEELVGALRSLGPVAQFPVPFSGVAMNSGLANPRVVVAPSAAPAGRPGGRAGFGGLDPFPGGPVPVRGVPIPFDQFPGQTERVAAPSPLGRAGVTDPDGIVGRLFLAANLAPDAAGKPKVALLEFISWNTRAKRFDFGVIDYAASPPEVQFLDGVRCFACHKNKGPILGQGPWSNTAHNDVARVAALRALAANPATDPGFPVPDVQPGVTGSPFLTPDQVRKTTFDGMSLVAPDPEACDAAVRRGAEFLRDREVFRAMARYGDGRKALAVLFAAVAAPGPIEEADARSRNAVDLAFNVTGANFCRDAAGVEAAASSTLADFSPSGSTGTLRSVVTNLPAGWGGGSTQRTDVVLTWGGDVRKVTEYDARRAAGDSGVPTHRRPSNPKAFVRPAAGVVPKPSAVANAVALARAVGLTEGDRAFLAEALAELARRVGKKATPAGLAREVFAAPAFAPALKPDGLPGREEFKERFAAALGEVAAAHKVSGGYAPEREAYASGPLPAADEGRAEPAVVPTTACLRCHDVRGAGGRPAFNPIPQLAFDPFDRDAREAWAKRAGAKERADVLGLMLRRLHADKDMPPEDSAEYDRFRVKDAAAFDAVRQWLEAEAKKAGAK